MHKSFVNSTDIIIFMNGFFLLEDDAARIDFMFQKESSDARFFFTIHDGPVDGGCTSILWQEWAMQIECAERWHIPYHFGQHAKGNYDL